MNIGKAGAVAGLVALLSAAGFARSVVAQDRGDGAKGGMMQT